jgi:hypothetical protein
MQIPGELERLIVAGKAKPDTLSVVGSGYNRWEIGSNKICIIYGVTVFPWVDYDRDTNPYHIFSLTFRSDHTRESIPIRCDDQQTPMQKKGGSIIQIPLYQLHRGVLTLDIRKWPNPELWLVTPWPVRPTDQAQPNPLGYEGQTAVKSIRPDAATVYDWDAWPNPDDKPGVFATTGNLRPEMPATANSVLESLIVPVANNEWSVPIILIHCVFCNSNNFTNLAVR